jgi:hypothetical protein
VNVCSGPNLAYFSKIASLEEMVGHIYGRIQLLTDSQRPNMFLNELRLYIDYLKNELLALEQELIDIIIPPAPIEVKIS